MAFDMNEFKISFKLLIIFCLIMQTNVANDKLSLPLSNLEGTLPKFQQFLVVLLL